MLSPPVFDLSGLVKELGPKSPELLYFVHRVLPTLSQSLGRMASTLLEEYSAEELDSMTQQLEARRRKPASSTGSGDDQDGETGEETEANRVDEPDFDDENDFEPFDALTWLARNLQQRGEAIATLRGSNSNVSSSAIDMKPLLDAFAALQRSVDKVTAFEQAESPQGTDIKRQISVLTDCGQELDALRKRTNIITQTVHEAFLEERKLQEAKTSHGQGIPRIRISRTLPADTVERLQNQMNEAYSSELARKKDELDQTIAHMRAAFVARSKAQTGKTNAELDELRGHMDSLVLRTDAKLIPRNELHVMSGKYADTIDTFASVFDSAQLRAKDRYLAEEQARKRELEHQLQVHMVEFVQSLEARMIEQVLEERSLHMQHQELDTMQKALQEHRINPEHLLVYVQALTRVRHGFERKRKEFGQDARVEVVRRDVSNGASNNQPSHSLEMPMSASLKNAKNNMDSTDIVLRLVFEPSADRISAASSVMTPRTNRGGAMHAPSSPYAGGGIAKKNQQMEALRLSNLGRTSSVASLTVGSDAGATEGADGSGSRDAEEELSVEEKLQEAFSEHYIKRVECQLALDMMRVYSEAQRLLVQYYK
jgi:hypothetical protein